MNVNLVTDSKISNLALMKISTFYKSMGCNVGFNIPNPDFTVYSYIFKDFGVIEPNGIIGGSGYDPLIKLPSLIEKCYPDYSLYPENKYSIGFTTRGCIRNCYFCIVPKKEGKFCRNEHPSKFYNPEYKDIMLLDNNWLADKEWFFETSNWIIEHKLKLIEHGMDIRLLDSEIAKQLKKLHFKGFMKFAFDNINELDSVLDGINILRRNGINPRHKVMFYVYCNDDNSYDDALRRAKILKNNNVSAFIMYNKDNVRTKRIKDLQRWCNRPMIFWTCDIDEYVSSYKSVP